MQKGKGKEDMLNIENHDFKKNSMDITFSISERQKKGAKKILQTPQTPSLVGFTMGNCHQFVHLKKMITCVRKATLSNMSYEQAPKVA